MSEGDQSQEDAQRQRNRRRRRRRSSGTGAGSGTSPEGTPPTTTPPNAGQRDSGNVRDQAANTRSTQTPSGGRPAQDIESARQDERRRQNRRGSAAPKAPGHTPAGQPSGQTAQIPANQSVYASPRQGNIQNQAGRAGQPNRQQSTNAPSLSDSTATTRGTRGKLRVIPLGGVGEVGKNMTVVEYENDLVLLDCGGKFPEEDQRGIDLIIPDVTYVKERRANLRAILITHGHEDHIGALPYILPLLKGKSPIPIYGSPLALGFIEGKLLEHRLEKLVELRRVGGGERIQLGKLSAEFIHVTHSIPDTNAIAIHSPVGTILDTADFKFDPTPVMGLPTDERRLRRLGDNGLLALFSDTVRVENAGSTPSEKVVLETIDEVVRTSRGQVVIATFASNISRLYMALLAAEKHGRKVAVAGRSMEQNARVALDLGYLAPPPGLLIPLDEALHLPREKRLLVITGSQGEAEAALARIAAAEHHKIRVAANDVVLVSATPVPGNEETVARTIDNLFRRGVKVVYSAVERGVHVSGHAGRDELRKMIDLVRPRFTIPIHGEFRHMVLYRDLCAQAGISADRVLLPEIGGVIEFTKDTAAHKGRVPSGTLLVDRLGDRGAGQAILRDRDHIADDGVIVVTIVVNRESGALIAGPDLVAKGLKPELNDLALQEAENELRRILERRARGEPQHGYLIGRTKEIVSKSLYRRTKSRPMILPVVTEL